MDEKRTTGQMVEDMITYATPIIMRWPKLFRYTLGERIMNQMYEISELCTAAEMKYYKKTTMQEIDIKKAQLLKMVRRAVQTKYEVKGREGRSEQRTLITIGTYEEWSGRIVTIGRMLGGWMKQISERKETKP